MNLLNIDIIEDKYLDPDELALNVFKNAFIPDKEITINQWADKYRVLPSVSSAEPGRYRTNRMPYLREIMEVLSPSSPVKQIKVIKGTQLGLTEVANNLIFCIMDCYAGGILMLMPTDSTAMKHSKQKIAPSLELMESLKTKIKSPKSRDSGNTILVKEFTGGILVMAGSNSPNSYRSFSGRWIIGDDVDGFVMDIGEQGAPLDLLKKRADAFPNHKIYINSSPTIKGGSNIEKEYEDSDQRVYFLPCPYCEHYQTLNWSGIKFSHENYELIDGTVFYECENCHNEIKEFNKMKMMENGRWIAQNPGHLHAGFKISSLYSPIGFLSWSDIVREFLKAKKELKFNRDKSAMVAWTNTRLAETWEDRGTIISEHELINRVENYLDGGLPDEILILTAGVDIQKDRIEYEIKGWGINEKCWGVEYGVILGPIDNEITWGKLNEKLLEFFETKNGHKLYIVCACIDSGYRSDLVYKFCRDKAIRRIYPVKGANVPGKPIISRASKDTKNNISLYMVGTDTAKERIYTRLGFKDPGSGYMHFPNTYDKEYFNQLTAEKLMIRFIKGYEVREWRKTRPRNEALDITVYNFAALEILNPNFRAIESNRITKDKTENEVKESVTIKQNNKLKRPKKSTWANRY